MRQSLRLQMPDIERARGVASPAPPMHEGSVHLQGGDWVASYRSRARSHHRRRELLEDELDDRMSTTEPTRSKSQEPRGKCAASSARSITKSPMMSRSSMT